MNGYAHKAQRLNGLKTKIDLGEIEDKVPGNGQWWNVVDPEETLIRGRSAING